MNVYTLRRFQEVHSPIAAVFAFFETPENLALLTPDWLGFRILTPSPVPMRENAVIDYTIRVLGIPVRWTSLITEYDRPFKFVDQQIKGPYSFWHHTHTFTERNGVTRMIDEVRYVLPIRYVDSIVHELFVARRLKQIFDYRARVIDDVFSDRSVPNSLSQKVECAP